MQPFFPVTSNPSHSSDRHLFEEPTVERVAEHVLKNLNPDIPTFLTINATGALHTESLLGTDPVADLYGRVASSDQIMIGLLAPAFVRSRMGACNDPTNGVVVHVLDRFGSAVTRLSAEATPYPSTPTSHCVGPSTDPQSGRIPDACRRILGLSTAVPTVPILSFVIGAWLEIITRHALEEPGFSWADVIAVHPSVATLAANATPADVAAATRQLGDALDWERFRVVIATVGGYPFGQDAQELASWMDAGMFSRWALEELPDQTDILDLLDGVLTPAALDRLWVSIRMCAAN